MSDERLDVLDVLARFAAGLDSCDFELYRSVFADEIEVDYSSYRPGAAGCVPAQTWVDRARRLFPGLDGTTHSIVNSRVAIDSDTAVVTSTMRADHLLDGQRYTLGGSYTHRLRRDGDGWCITGVSLQVRWEEGDRALLDRGRERAARAG